MVTFPTILADMTTLHAQMSDNSANFHLHQRWGARLPGAQPGGHDRTMAIRTFTLTTAAGLALLCAQADAGQASLSLATGSAAATSTMTVKEAATTAAASMTIEAPTPAATPAPEPEPPAVTGGVNVDLFSHYVWRG